MDGGYSEGDTGRAVGGVGGAGGDVGGGRNGDVKCRVIDPLSHVRRRPGHERGENRRLFARRSFATCSQRSHGLAQIVRKRREGEMCIPVDYLLSMLMPPE